MCREKDIIVFSAFNIALFREIDRDDTNTSLPLSFFLTRALSLAIFSIEIEGTLPMVVYVTARDEHTGRTGGDRDKNVFVGASACILRRPNNYIPRVAARRPSRRVHVPVVRPPSCDPHPPPLPPPSSSFSSPHVSSSSWVSSTCPFPPGKFRYAWRRTVIREIKAAPLTCPAFQCRLCPLCLRRALQTRDSAFDSVPRGCRSCRPVTFQFARPAARLTASSRILYAPFTIACSRCAR